MADTVDQVMGKAVEQVFRALTAEIAEKQARARALADTRARVRELTRVAERMVAVLPEHTRRAGVQRLAALRARGSRGHDAAEDKRARAIAAFLQAHRGVAFRPRDLTDWLKARHIACPDSRYAARTLGRKARQGAIRRMAHGSYRVN